MQIIETYPAIQDSRIVIFEDAPTEMFPMPSFRVARVVDGEGSLTLRVVNHEMEARDIADRHYAIDLGTEKIGIRAYVFNFVGNDGRHASVVFDRYGRNAEQFEKYGRNQLTSNAIGSIMQDASYGVDWIDSFKCQVIDA